MTKEEKLKIIDSILNSSYRFLKTDTYNSIEEMDSFINRIYMLEKTKQILLEE